jgi:dynein light chain 1
MKGIHVLKELKVLVMSNNNVKDWGEFNKLADLKKLEELVFNGNPLEEKHKDEGNWIEMASEKVQRLQALFFNFSLNIVSVSKRLTGSQ